MQHVGVNISYYPGANINESIQGLNNYPWVTTYIYDSRVDPKSYGYVAGYPRRAMVSGAAADGVFCGSRNFAANFLSVRYASSSTTRGCIQSEYYPGANFVSGQFYFNTGYTTWSEPFVYHSPADSIKYGKCYGATRRLVSGGKWNDSANCGSRSINGCNFPTRTTADQSTRGCIVRVLSWGKRMLLWY